MNTKLIAGGLGLVGFGALWGWAITGDRMEARMKNNQLLLGTIIERQSRELIAAKELLMDLAGAGEDEENEGGPQGETVPEAVVETKFSEDIPVAEQLRGETPEETRENLASLIGEFTHPEDAQAFVEMAEPMLDPGPDNTPPFVISQDAYVMDPDEGDSYAKVNLLYFPKHKILLDDGEDLINNKEIDNMVGWQNLERFGDESNDADVVYIRNRRLLTDFEVVRETEANPPAHIDFNMDRDEYEFHRAAGHIKFRDGDE